MNTSSYRRPYVFAAACAGILLFGISFIVLGALLNQITAQYQISQVQAGSLTVILALGILVGSIVFGPVVDRYGYKLLLIICGLLTAFGMLGLGQAHSFWELQLAIFLIGSGGGALNGGTSALVVDISQEGKGGADLSILGVFWGIGALGMPLILGSLTPIFPYENVLTGMGIVMLSPVLFFGFITFPQPKQKQGFPLSKGLTLMRDPLLLIIGMVLFFQSGIESLINNWSTSFLENFRQIDPPKAKFALSASILALTLARLAVGSILRNVRPDRILYAGMALSFVGILLLWLGTGFMSSMAALFLMGLGVAAGFPLVLGYVGNLYAQYSGTAFSVVFVIALIGNMVINYLMGAVSEKYGIENLPVLMTSSLVFLALFFTLSLRNMKRKEQPES